jgi:hypothetical protein
MSENDALYLAQEFLARMGSGAEPAEIAKLFKFSENTHPQSCESDARIQSSLR